MAGTLITGASSGVGRSVARRLAQDGVPVIVSARRGDLLESLVAEIHETGGQALAQPCDITNTDAVDEMVRIAEETFGPIQRLVAIAGGGTKTPVSEFRATTFEQIFRINVIGTVNCIEAVLPAMLERDAGHIVTMGSLAGHRGLPTAGAYTAAKAAIYNLTESLRLELRSTGIDVTLLTPGFIRTKQNKKHKPFQVELDLAAEHIFRAIMSRRSVCAFPMPLVLATGLMRCLPASLYDRLIHLLWRRNKKAKLAYKVKKPR